MIKTITVVLLFISQYYCSQVSYYSWVNSYIQINSYDGNTNPDAYTAMMSGNGNFNIASWRLSAKLKQPIKSTDGNYTIPGNKISLHPVASSGQGEPGPVPTIPQIGMPLNVILQEGQEVFLVPNSNAPLYNQPSQPNGYYNLQIKFSLTVMGGAYLGSYPAWMKFYAPVEFTMYDKYNNVIGKMTHNFEIQIGTLSGTPPVDPPQMSLTFAPNAQNALLEFKSMEDYTNGVSVTYNNALMVKSNTNYQIKLKSLQSQFTSSYGNTIPIDAVKLALSSATVNTNVYPISLSATSQLVAKGNATQGNMIYYDVKYSTIHNDEIFINAKSDDYTATLQYEITPQ
jgi:hypothetical protein